MFFHQQSLQADFAALARTFMARGLTGIWRTRALEAESRFTKTGENPLEHDTQFRNDFLELVEQAQVENLADLSSAERALDLMYSPLLRTSRAFILLREKARMFIESQPHLLTEKWVRTAGSVYDLLDETRTSIISSPPRQLH